MPEQGFRVGIDARYLSHGLIGGVHTYVESLISALLQLDSPHQYVLYGDAKAPFDISPLPPHAELQRLPWHSGISTIRNDLRIGSLMARHGVDVAHFPANFGFGPAAIPALITLHDAINVLPLRQILKDDRKDPRHVLVMTYLHLMTLQSLRHAPSILTVSDFSKRGIMKSTGIPEERIFVVHSAPDASFRPSSPVDEEALRSRLNLRSFVVLADAIKNPYCTLRAFKALPQHIRDETTLVFFSRREPVSEVTEAARAGLCQLVLRPSRDDLICLFSLSDVFVFPSWYEGFGLPVLESMACGTTVIASSRGSLPEITGDGGVIIDAEDHLSIARELTRLHDDECHRSAMSARALKWAGNFSWKRTAERTLQLYDDLIGHRRGYALNADRHSARTVSRESRDSPLA